MALEDIVIQKTPLEGKLWTIVEPIVANRDYELVDIRVLGQGNACKVCLYIGSHDPESSVGLDALEHLSHLIGDTLDVADSQEHLLKDSYQLEVSSPGLDRPLVKISHFQQMIGKHIRFKTSHLLGGPKQATAILKAVSTEGIEVILEQKEEKQLHIPWANLADARLVYSFKQKNSHKPKMA